MIDKIDTNQPLIESGLSSGQPNLAGALPDNDADVSVQVSYASLIEKAKQGPETDPKLMQEARELLKSGRLDSPRNVLEAAENIVKFGI